MGFFSWITCDTERSVSNIFAGTEGIRKCYPVYVLIPQEYGGGHIEETAYEGYGDFGGHDIYDLVVDWNLPYITEKFATSTDCVKNDNESSYFKAIARDIFHLTPEEMIAKHGKDYKRNFGIVLACYDSDNAKLRYPIKIADHPDSVYEDFDYSPSCPHQGYFYPDEGYDDDEYWDDEEDDEEEDE